MFKKYNFNNLLFYLKENPSPILLFGAGDLGSLAKFAFDKIGIKINFFCDSDERKQKKFIEGIKVISPEELYKFSNKKTHIFISHNYPSEVIDELIKNKFTLIYDCVEILKNTNFDHDHYLDYFKYFLQPQKILRRIDFYSTMIQKNEHIKENLINIKSVDVQITERCSLKCKDCANLMQYYQKPANSNIDTMFLSIEKLMEAIDSLDEFRLLGGDPFMNKDIGKIIEKLSSYEKVKKIVVYTNATIIPKGENFEALKNKKIVLDISNYGTESRKHDELIKLLNEFKIKYSTTRITKWTDSGRVLPFQDRSEKELKKMFVNCCNSDLLTLLHGNLFRCPFSANGENIHAFPKKKEDSIDLTIPTPFEELRKKIFNLIYKKDYLLACNYCNGRDYSTKEIEAAIQTKIPLSF
jgi:organic radical activating enzyme